MALSTVAKSAYYAFLKCLLPLPHEHVALKLVFFYNTVSTRHVNFP